MSVNFRILDTDALTTPVEIEIINQKNQGWFYHNYVFNYRTGKTSLVFSNQASLAQNFDSFGRLRTAEPQTQFDSKQIADNQFLFWDDKEVSGSGTSSVYNTNRASTTLWVGAEAGRRVRQTRRWFNYQPGKAQLVEETGVFGEPEPGITRRVGLFNDQNGIFFQNDPDGAALGIRSFTTGTTVDRLFRQEDWNYDKMDGTGPSGFDLDFTKTQIFFFDFEWLGVGTVAYGFFVNRSPIYVHFEHHANKLEEVYMSTPNLPLRYEIENDGTGQAAFLKHICTTVINEGGRQATGLERGINRGLTPLVTNNDALIYPLSGLRLKSTHLGAFIRLIDFSLICTSTSDYAVYVIVNPTIVGTAPTWLDLEHSSIQYAIPTNTTTVTGGTVIYTAVSSDTNQAISGVQRTIESDLVIGSDIDGTPDTIFLCVQRLTGTTETFYAAINFSETN
jgi:hypothetical protein